MVSIVTVTPPRSRYAGGTLFHEVEMLRIVLIVAIVGLAVLLVSALPDIRRYLRIRGM